MAHHTHLRTPSDADFDAYSRYIAKLASIASPGDPPVTPFRTWFFWHYQAFPATQLIDDKSVAAA